MSKNWLNQIIRLLLVIIGLYSIGMYCSTIGDGFLPYFLCVVGPACWLVAWWVFRYPNDPRKNPVIPIGGKLRIALELAFFALAIYSLNQLDYPQWSKYLLYAVVFHYIVSYDRVLLLWHNQPIE